MPRPARASDLPTRTPYPRDLEEVSMELAARLARGHPALFAPIPGGFPRHNQLFGGGYHAGDLVVVGGVQNVGKTAWILQDASAVAAGGALALVVCYEHTTLHLLERLLCQQSGPGDLPVTVDALRDTYRAVLEERPADGTGRLLDGVVARLPGALAAWNRVARLNKRLWLVMGDSEYTTPEALDAYIQLGLQYNPRLVVYVDYAQAVPVFSRERALTIEERVEKLFRFAKARAMHASELGQSVVIVLVAAADAEGLRQGRVHVENLWGTAVTQFEPDVALILNRDGRDADGVQQVRIGLEKNRHGPADVEYRYRYHGAQYTFEPEGAEIAPAESWQAERFRPRGGLDPQGRGKG